MAKTLGHFSITAAADGYVLHMEDEDGDSVEYSATAEQLDLITESIEELLDLEEEEGLGIDDDEDEQPGEE